MKTSESALQVAADRDRLRAVNKELIRALGNLIGACIEHAESLHDWLTKPALKGNRGLLTLEMVGFGEAADEARAALTKARKGGA